MDFSNNKPQTLPDKRRIHGMAETIRSEYLDPKSITADLLTKKMMLNDPKDTSMKQLAFPEKQEEKEKEEKEEDEVSNKLYYYGLIMMLAFFHIGNGYSTVGMSLILGTISNEENFNWEEEEKGLYFGLIMSLYPAG